MAEPLKVIDAITAAELADNGALLVDVREDMEFAQARIPGSVNVPLSGLEALDIPAAPDQPIIFFCASGNRTNVHRGRLQAKAGETPGYVLGGGIVEWAQAGLPIETD